MQCIGRKINLTFLMVQKHSFDIHTQGSHVNHHQYIMMVLCENFTMR